MKVLFVSDIHGSLFYANQVIEVFKKESCDYIVSLGDLLYHGPRNPLPKDYNPQAVASLLNEYKEKIISVKGNCDSEVDQMILDFPILAEYSNLMLDGHRFFLTHGLIYHQDCLPPLNKGDVFVHGHFHVPMILKKEDIYVINPSSCSLPKKGNHSYGIYENHVFTIKDFDGHVVDSIELNHE